jgi:hypothetical protein
LVELIDGLWPEGVANLRSGESDPYHPEGVVTVVADIVQLLKSSDCVPEIWVEGLGNGIGHAIRLIGCSGRK